eukprot:COSAG01_NODE_2418_length_7734_cov_8.527570_5_plen_385_part_01
MYDLIVVDEAHHIWLDEHFRTEVEHYKGKRRMLLSDVSQGLHEGLSFPDDLDEVELTEIVRCSKRVISAAMKFQLQKKTLLDDVPCHHASDGPPLKSFIFDVADGSDRYETYASQTLQAVRSVQAKFDGLNLHNRLAIVVPDSEFRAQLLLPLERQLEEAYPQQFELVDAATASRQCFLGGINASSDKQVVTMDAIAQVDGMEWLIVACVGLDSAKQATGTGTSDMEFAETRSRLYRGVTRAHMMVLAVNEYIKDGWLAFLTTVRLVEHKKFNAKKTLAAAEQDFKLATLENAKRMAAAAKLNDELNAQAEEAVLVLQKSNEEESAFLKREVLRLLQRGTELEQAVAQAEGTWLKDREAQQAERDLQTQVDAFMQSYKLSLADDE